ncbi:hypothetical protein ACA910_003054 [Epithemia clementina (nom. ined.)]
MNVEEILSVVASLEATYEEQNKGEDGVENFGHPEAPQMALQKLFCTNDNDDDALLLVVFSKHSIAAQVVSSSGSTKASTAQDTTLTPVFRVCALVGETAEYEEENSDDYHFEIIDADETIQCLLVVELETVSICSDRIPQAKDQTINSFVFAVVFGTNRNRLLVSELIVSHNEMNDDPTSSTEWTIECLSGHHGGNIFEVLPCDDSDVVDLIRRKNKIKSQEGSNGTLFPFQPSGGVSGISCGHDMAATPLEPKTTYVWITYKDGNIVRMHHAALFPSVWVEASNTGVSVDDLLSQYNHTALLRCRVRLEPGMEQHVSIQPLPKYHPSPLAPVSFAGLRDVGQTQEMCHEALVFGSSDSSFPTLCVYTSENHFWEPPPLKKSESLVADVTKALMGGVVGALRWATTSKSNIDDPRAIGSSSVADSSGGGNKPQNMPSRPFPSIWQMPISLFAGPEFHDVPRIVEQCTVDPEGQYAALADGLGRVILLDLSTKQVMRMWKGLRQASCYWGKVNAEKNQRDDQQAVPRGRSKSFLVLHSKQRRIVEVWPSKSGDRLASFQVNRNSLIIPCPQTVHHGQKTKHPEREHCVYVLDSTIPGGLASSLKRIQMDTILRQEQRDDRNRSTSREATMHVYHLKQILSADIAMLSSEDDVLEAFCRIKSLHDLSSCLDLVATSSVLEDELRVEGAAFQKLALKYCSEKLQEAQKANEEVASSGAAALSKKINYYSRLIKAYDLLREYESAGLMDAKRSSLPLSNFSQEALGWNEVYETVTSIVNDETSTSNVGSLTFSQFASSCILPPDDSTRETMKIYLSESTRKRQEILRFLFRPLLGWFSSGVVGSVFEALGIRDDAAYVLRCFGEWFLNLTMKEIQERCLTQPQSPMSRFLQDTLLRGINKGLGTLSAIDSLSTLCEESTDLVRAFMLATLAHEVQVNLSQQKAESFGDALQRYTLMKQVSSTAGNLELLLRKIRVCLLVSMRLYGKDLAPFPLSVKNIEKEKDYSVFKWMALDELLISNQHEEIVTLEKACALSAHKVNPFSSDADEPQRFKLLHESCKVFSDKTRAGEILDKSGSLLLFFPAYNHHQYLAAHRALLFAYEWVKDPGDNNALRRSLAALNSLPRLSGPISVAYVVALHIWTRIVAPIYRARLFGSSDIPEIQEECVAPFLENREWLAEFGRMALQMLVLLQECSIKDNGLVVSPAWGCSAVDGETSWPPPAPDHTLHAIAKETRKIEPTAVDTHIIAVCALLFFDDKRALIDCIPPLDHCFHNSSLFNPMFIPTREAQQEMLLSDAIISVAFEYSGGPVDSFSLLGELERLTSLWGFDKKWPRTTFLIAMYELGKDNVVDGLMIAAISQIFAEQLIVAGVNIVCRRIDRFLTKAKSSNGPEARNIMSLLDAELCEWIHERSESSTPLIPRCKADVDIEATRILTIRLLNLGSSSNADAGIRARIHALSVLSGILARTNEGS